ncbi:MAG: hypothetical protein QNL91_03185, partial [Candidatus Krumholzibacteria bacterium]|nr:hypothetical protein [Candidatus Krumholzibacteria bacterium]
PLLGGLGGLYVLLAVYATAATVVPSWRRSLQLTATEKRTARWLAILLLALNWAWLVRRYLFSYSAKSFLAITNLWISLVPS